MVKQVKKTASDTVIFTKRLSGVTAAISLAGLGVYAVYLPHTRNLPDLCAVAITFAGAINVIAGSLTLYRVLMNQE